MTATEIQQAIDLVKKFGHFVEVKEAMLGGGDRRRPVLTLQGVRKSSSGELHEVRLDLFDGGAKAGHLRYSCEGRQVGRPTGRLLGNPEPTLKEVILTLHWDWLEE